jgi:hypothetical protein
MKDRSTAMEITFWEQIASIPWWIYAFFTLVIYLQCQSLKMRTFSLKSVAISSIGLVCLGVFLFSLHTMLKPFIASKESYFYFSLATIVGILVGTLQFFAMRPKFLPETNQIQIPPSWLNFIASLGLFAGTIYLHQHYNLTELLSPMILASCCMVTMGIGFGRLFGLTFICKANKQAA